MKKVTALLLLFLFLITNSGMAVSMHWCGGNLTSIHFFSADKHPCKCGNKAMKPGCCSDKTITLKAKNDLAKVNQFAFKLTLEKFSFPAVKQIEVVPYSHFQYSASAFYYPPPFKPKAPIYLLDGVFLI